MTVNRLSIRADWPFGVARAPFFYGWVIWGLSTIGILMSVPGQTMGMAVFTDTFIEVLGLSRTELAVAYFFGTVTSAFLLPRAGRAFDRFGARLIIVGSSAGLAVVLVFISVIDVITARVAAGSTWATFALILIGYFGVRFLGQGVLTSAARNVLMLWFDRRRGFVTGISSPFVSLGFSLAPVLLAAMIAGFGWRGALWILAAVVGVGFTAVALVLVRDTPEACGLLPDGEKPSEGEAPGSRELTGQTAAEAKRSPVFWIYALGLASHALFGTAVTFHIVSIFAEAGRTQEEAFGQFFPSAVVYVSVNLLVGWIADFRPLKPMLVTMLVAFLAGSAGLINLETDWGYWMLVTGFGAGGGLWGVLMNLAFVRFFGRKHLGEIAGFNIAITVFGSAIGPVLFSLGRDFSGSYQAPILVCVVGLILLVLAAVVIPQDDPLRKLRRTQTV